MLEQLKRKTMPGKLALAAVWLVLGGVLFAYLLPSLLLLIRGPQDFYALTTDQLEGSYVSADIEVVYDWYAETVQQHGSDPDTTTLSREYLVPTSDGNVLGVQVPASMIPTAESVMEDTYLWLTDPDYVWNGEVLSVEGTVQAMDQETQDLFYEALVDGYGLTEEELGSFRPLLLIHGDIGTLSRGELMVLGLADLAMLAAGVVLVVFALTGHYQKPIRRYCAAQPDPESLREALDRFYEDTPAENRLRCSRDWVLYEDGGRSWLLSTRDIAWVYGATVTHRTNGIRTGQTHSVKVCSLSEPRRLRRHTVRVRNPEQTRAVIDQIARWVPQAVYGYEPAWDHLYDKDPRAFLDRMQQARREEPAPPADQPAPAAPADSANPAGSGPSPKYM